MFFPPPLPLGCDRVCHYGTTGACRAPEVRRSGPPTPFDVARAPGGACGPEAKHMFFPGLHGPEPTRRNSK